MSTLTVTNIQTANSSVPLTLTTGNTTAGDIIVNNDQVLMFANSTTNVTINSTSIAIAGVSKVSNLPSTSGNQITVTQQLFLSGNVTPTKLAANTSAWNPGTGVYNIRAEANSTTVYYSLFGLTAGLDGQEITITNINATPIIIRNEDSANESTAANRFNMPNHIKLDGYMSAQFYYDGTLDRWRLIDSVNIPFDHKYSLTKGIYTAGWNGTTNLTTADKITYATEANAAISGANLPIATRAHTATGNADKGFNSGGYANPGVATANTFRTAFSTETLATVTGANLSQARFGVRATGNVDKGFFSGGCPSLGSPCVATADRINYSTETTAAVSGANISQGRENYTAVGTSDKGFYVGGRTPATAVATSDRTTYSTETNAAVSGSNLSVARGYNSSAGNADKGFVVGGSAPNNTVVDRITYSSETTASTTAFTAAMDGGVGAGNDTKGFFAGGNLVAAAYRLTYSSESSTAVSGANLSQARFELTAF